MNNSFSRFNVRPGWVEVVVGCMFSGKTEELLAQIRRAQIARQNYLVFKPDVDTRYSEDHVASHDKQVVSSISIKEPGEIYQHVERKTDIIGIDEAQFFDDSLVEVCEKLAMAGKRVVVAGLDTDWQGRPFGPIPQLLASAEIIHKKYAICMVCGEPATRTQRLSASQRDILLGSTEAYEARCRNHFDPQLSLRLANNTSTEVRREL